MFVAVSTLLLVEHSSDRDIGIPFHTKSNQEIGFQQKQKACAALLILPLYQMSTNDKDLSSNAEVEVWVHTKLDSTSKVCQRTKFIFQNIFQDIFVVKLFCISFKIRLNQYSILVSKYYIYILVLISIIIKIRLAFHRNLLGVQTE